jgi:hypothetical protein
MDQLGALDLSGIVAARSSISTAVSAPDLERLMAQGIGPNALGAVGAGLQALQGALAGDPAALLAPAGALIQQVAGELHVDISTAGLLHATTEAVQLFSAVVAALGGDMSGLSAALGAQVPGLLGDLAGRVGVQPSGALSDLAEFTRLVAAVEAGAPTDPGALADLVLQATLPFPVTSLRGLRQRVDALQAASAAVALPDSRTTGLQQAVAAVATAAAGSDTAALRRALASLEQARVATIAQLSLDLQQIASATVSLQLDALSGELTRLAAPLHTAETGVLDLLADLRAQLVAAKGDVAGADFTAVGGFLDTLVGELEAEAVAAVEPLITEAVSTAQQRLGAFLDRLGLRQARAEVLGAVHEVAVQIAAHDPTAPLAELYSAIDSVRKALDPANLGQEVQQALQAVVASAESALQQVIDGLATIKAGVQAVAAEAEPPLTQATQAIETFASAIREVQAALENLDVAKMGQSVVQSLHGVTQTVQQLTSAVTLPDALRPQITSLADSIRAVDLQTAVEQPVAQALAGLQLPDDAAQSLEKVVDAIRHLIPAQLIASIEADVNGLLEQLTHLHPDLALGSLNDFVHGAADKIGSFKLADHVDVLEPAFHAVQDALAALDPAALFRPIIDAYDRLTSALAVPGVSDVAGRLGAAIGSAVDATAGQLTSSLATLPGVSTAPPRPATGTSPASPGPPPGGTGTPGPGTPGGGTPGSQVGGAAAADLPVRPGDAIRLLGHLPALLRDALSALDTPAVQACLATVDNLTGGLAADLRSLALAVSDIEARVAATLDTMVHGLAVPVASAQLAVAAHLEAQADDGGLDVDTTLLAIGRAGPAGLAADLSGTLGSSVAAVRAETAQLGGSAGASLEQAAAALDACRLAGATADLSTFLAAIDPEPVAAALDDLVLTALGRAPDLVAGMGQTLANTVERLRALVERYQPAAVAMRFLPLLQLVDDEIALLDPRALGAEVEDIYRLIVDTVAAYDPAQVAAAVDAEIAAVADELRAVDVATLVPDTSFLQPLADKVQAASPLPLLSGAAASLDAVAQRLEAVDLDQLIADVNGLGPQVSAAFDQVAGSVQQEILALLDALQFGGASGSASVSASGSVSGGGGG